MKKLNHEIEIHEDDESGNVWACVAVCASMCSFTFGQATTLAVAYYLA